MNNLTKEEVFQAIKQGVKEAFEDMMESKDCIRTEQVMKAIEDGISMSMPFSCDIKKAISDATYDAIRNSQ